MKKLLIIPAVLIALPAFSACSIEGGETVCTLPNFREQISPIYQESPSATPYPNAQLQPLNRTDPIEQMRGPNNTLNYNSGCQFGVCLQNPNKSTLPIQK